MDDYVGQWDKSRQQIPSEFKNERVLNDIKVVLPIPPTINKIVGFDKPKKEQRWVLPHIPSDKEIASMPSEERKKLIQRELDRRINGYFFYNAGGIEYITGIHYFYLTYWRIMGTGLPDFRDSDRDFFYIWDSIVKDKDCFGLLYFTGRRDGKTEKALNILYEYTSLEEEVNSGIQSQTTPDAKQIFTRLIHSWKKMPYFWKPTDSGESNPKKELKFEEPSARNTKGVVKRYKRVLNSKIDFRASNEGSYDGYALWRYYCDEFGKFEEGDSYSRWNTVKPTLLNGLDIRGKAIMTTTVEDIDKQAGKQALLLWKDSDPLERKRDGRTKSGMYRWFKPAYYGLHGFINEYGYSEIEKAKKALLDARDGLEGEMLIQETRKFPFNPKEAFQSSAASNVFSSYKINQQLDHNATNNAVARVGNFIWEDKENHKVKFVDDPINGKFKVSWIPPENEQNKFEIVRGLPKPIFSHKGGFGVDPFDHRTTAASSSPSDGACVGFRNYDALNPVGSNSFFLTYLNRPPKETILYEDLVKAFIFYGMEALIENNKQGIINWMIDNGYKYYIKRTQQGDYTKTTSRAWVNGVAMSGELVRELAIGNLETYIYDYIGKISPDIQKNKMGIQDMEINPDLHGTCVFTEMLEDWIKFDSGKWTEYDITVASMLARLCVTPVRKRKSVAIEDVKFSIESFFKINKI